MSLLAVSNDDAELNAFRAENQRLQSELTDAKRNLELARGELSSLKASMNRHATERMEEVRKLNEQLLIAKTELANKPTSEKPKNFTTTVTRRDEMGRIMETRTEVDG